MLRNELGMDWEYNENEINLVELVCQTTVSDSPQTAVNTNPQHSDHLEITFNKCCYCWESVQLIFLYCDQLFLPLF